MKRILYLASIAVAVLFVTSCSTNIDPESFVKDYMDAVVNQDFANAYSIQAKALGEATSNDLASVRQEEMKEIQTSLEKYKIWITGYEIKGVDDIDEFRKDVKTVITYQNGKTSDFVFHFAKNDSGLWRWVSVKTHKYDAFAQKFFDIISIPSKCQEEMVGEDMAAIRYNDINNKWITDEIDPVETTDQFFKARLCEDKAVAGVMFEEIYAAKNTGTYKLEKTPVNDYSIEDLPIVTVDDTTELHPVAVTVTMVNEMQSRTYTDTLFYAKNAKDQKWTFEKYSIDAKCISDENEAPTEEQ